MNSHYLFSYSYWSWFCILVVFLIAHKKSSLTKAGFMFCTGCLNFPYSHQSTEHLRAAHCMCVILFWDKTLPNRILLCWLCGEPRQLLWPRPREDNRIWSWSSSQSSLDVGTGGYPTKQIGTTLFVCVCVCVCAAGRNRTESFIGSERILDHCLQCLAFSQIIWLGNESIKAWNKICPSYWPNTLKVKIK